MEKIEHYKHALDEFAIVAVTDPNGIIIHVNENFCKTSKYRAEELIGQDHRIINSGYHTKEFMKNLWTTISKGKVWKGELRNQAKDGSTYWVDTTIVPFMTPDGLPYQYVSIRSNITERKKSEEKLEKTLKELSDYKYALDESAIVAITDQKGKITYVNDNFCRISKFSAEELVGQDHRIINSGYHSREFIQKLWKTIAKGHVWKGELKNRAKNGTIYWVDTTIVPFLKPDGKPYQYIAIRSDITERKKGEEHIKNINQKAEEHTQELEYKNNQLVDFCNIVSHNLRAPLINISMLVDYLEQCSEEADRIEVQGKIRPVVNHLLEIFNELVESIQVKQDKEIEAEKIHLQECLNRIMVGFNTQAKEYGAVLRAEFNEVPMVRFPRKYMESIFSNLISNALKYKHPERSPVIEIQTRKSENGILLSVADNGLGIDLQRHSANLFKIRKTFHRHVDAKGLGLFMTKTQVEAMGGKIWVESTPGKGSVFFVEINDKENEKHQKPYPSR